MVVSLVLLGLTITIHIPQTIVIICMLMNVFCSIFAAGESKGNWNPLFTILEQIFLMIVFYWGGFFG